MKKDFDESKIKKLMIIYLRQDAQIIDLSKRLDISQSETFRLLLDLGLAQMERSEKVKRYLAGDYSMLLAED